MTAHALKLSFHVQSKGGPKEKWKTVKAFPSHDAAMVFACSLDEDGCEPNGGSLRIKPIAG